MLSARGHERGKNQPCADCGEEGGYRNFAVTQGMSIRWRWKIARCVGERGGRWWREPTARRANVAVACDCGMEERAVRVMERARIPKRYEHCDFESYVTDLADGKTWTATHSQSLKQAKMLAQGFVRDYPGSAEKGLLLMGPSGVGKTHLAVASLKELDSAGSRRAFLRLPRTVEGNSGQL